jgi:predicted 3-demethylubiquinone-9 3-methyltransferase (glyoxalase superfamily)
MLLRCVEIGKSGPELRSRASRRVQTQTFAHTIASSSPAAVRRRVEEPRMQKISTCLWFDHQAEEAATFYVSLFPNSRVVEVNHYLKGAPRPAGSVMTAQFTLDGTEYVALNGGPNFKFSPAISLVAHCDTQEEVDTLWRKLSEGGQAGQCGWLTDRYGVSWQVVPRALLRLLNAADKAASQRAFSAMMKMTKLDIAALHRAYGDA